MVEKTENKRKWEKQKTKESGENRKQKKVGKTLSKRGKANNRKDEKRGNQNIAPVGSGHKPTQLLATELK